MATRYEERIAKLKEKYGSSTSKNTSTLNPVASTAKTGGSNTPSAATRVTVPSSKSAKATSMLNKLQSKYATPASKDNFVTTFLKEAQAFLDKSVNTVNGLNWSSATSGDVYKTWKEERSALQERADNIRSYLETNKSSISMSTYKALNSVLDDFYWSGVHTSLAFRDAEKFYSQWATENDYEVFVAQQKDYEAKRTFDVSAGEREIEELKKRRSEMVTKNNISQPASAYQVGGASYATSPYAASQQSSSHNKEIAELDALISQKTAYLNQAKRIQEGIMLASVADSPDFKDYSGYVSTESDNWWDKMTSQYGMEYDDLTYEYINNRNGIREEIKRKHLSYSSDNPFSDGESTFEEKGYDYLKQNEIDIYNYYYAKEGKEAAEKYLDSIQETLNHRKATGMYKNMEDKTLLELAFGVSAGLDQFESGMKGAWNDITGDDSYVPKSATQMASGMVREDLGEVGPNLPKWLGGASVGQMGYDAVTTSANMLPSIMTSTAMNFLAPGSGAVVGTAMMGASAAGNAYQEMINLGYDKHQARAYATLVGGSEAGLQYLLGGIGKLGGKLSGNAIAKVLNGVDNAFARVAIQLGGNMLSEGIEEGMQEILNPWFKNLVFHTNEDVNWSEVAYSTLLGALTAGFMEGGNTISGEVNTYKTGKQLQVADISAQRLAEIGQTFSADTVAYQLAGRVNENTGAYTIGRLFNEIGATLTEQNVSEITNALVAKGMDSATARKNAEALAYVVEGGQLSERQIAVIEANEVLAEVARTTLIDANTTWNQRSNAYNEVMTALSDETANYNTSRTNPAGQRQENTTANGNVDTQNNDGAQSLPEAVDTSPAKVQTISAIKNGQVTVKLEDGTEVNMKDADLDVDDGVRIETIGKLEGITPTDANFILNTLRTNTGASAKIDSLGAREAYKYGFYGFSQDHMTTHGVFANSLTETQRKSIYEIGRNARVVQVAAQQTAVTKNAVVAKPATTGKVHFDGNRSVLTERQNTSLTALESVADALGVQIYVFESELNERGQRVGANGWYDPKDGSIHIDLHAGANGEGTMLFTAAHELTHHVRQWSPEKFKTLSDFLMQEYGERGVNVDALVREQMAKAERNGRTISYDTAFEEVVADSMETMLSDGKIVEKLAKLKAQDKSLWQKIKDFISELAAKIRAVYDGLSPDSIEGRYVAEMAESVEKLQELFAEGLVEASENYQAAMAQAGVTFDAANKILSEYQGGHRSFPVAKDVVTDFVNEYKGNHKGTKYSDRDSDANQIKLTSNANPTGNPDIRYSFRGTNQDGIEVYETSQSVMNLSWKDRKTQYLDVMRNVYRGRTARFERNGHIYYAAFDQSSIRKHIFGDKRSSPDGAKALIKAGADGDVFDLVERSRYTGSKKNTKNHTKADYFDYFVKTVQIDGKVFDLVADVEKIYGVNGGYVYTLALIDNKTIKASPALGTPNAVPVKNAGNASATNVTQPASNVNNNLSPRSDRDSESVSNRSLLANALESVAQSNIEKQKIQEYKDKISNIEAAELKLSDLNKQIKELSFAKGPRDKDKIRKLREEATKTTNRINIYDKQLLRLEASKPLQDVLSREKKKAYQRAEKKGKEALEAYREKALKTQQEMLAKWQESRKKGIDSRNRTAMRHKIQKVVSELNQYLLRGTKDRHIPIELQKAVAEALDAVNMDTVGAEERIAKLQAELMKAETTEKIQEISRKIDHIQQMGDRMNERLKKLKDAYDQFVNSDDPLIANSHDEVISNKLQSVIESVGDTPLRDMTLTQLEDVYDMYRMVLTTIRNANKVFKAKKSESISAIASQVMTEVKKAGGNQKLGIKGMDGIKNFMWNNLKPVYAFEHIGSEAFTDVFNAVRAGEDVWAVDVTEARAFYLDKSKKHNYDSWDFKKRFDFQSTSGMDFSLDLEQIMSLYAYSKRDQAADHLRRGGIVIDETTEITVKNKLGLPVKFNPTEATAYNISNVTLAEIISKLTPEQKNFVDEMQDYLSTTMGAKGNEVSLEMYGVKLFKEKFYFPLKSAQQFMAKAKEQQQGEVKIKNSGFSKETVQKASNPIVLTPFMNVWANHVNEMSMYHAFVLPMEDFYRVYNYKTPTSETAATESVEMFIQNAYGKGATKYIDQLLKDLNGGARTDNTTGVINKMMGLFKKGAVFASMSVVVQQPSAIARAAALVDTKYFIGPKVDHKRHKTLWEEVKQYAPVAIIKEMGYFDTNMGKSTQDFILGKEYSGFAEKMKALVTDSDYRDEVLSKAPALADEIAWCSIWEAVKREMHDKHPGLDAKSEPFLMLCGSRFTEVITKTQVYDSVLSRSGNMRSKDTGMKMATAFMAEPTTSINMIADALLQGKRGNKKYVRRAIGAVIASQILNSILVSFVYAGRDDDEDETYLEKYIGTFTGEMLDSLNPAGYIPFIKDIVSIVQGYDVERSDMAVISDLWKAWENLSKDNVSVYRKVEGFVGSIAQIFGLPIKNIMRDVRGIYQTIDSFVNGERTTKAGIGYALKSAMPEWMGGGNVSNDEQLYAAILGGDQIQIDRVKGRYKDEKDIISAMRSAIKDHLLAGDIDSDTAIKYMVNYCGDKENDAFWKVEEWRHDQKFEEDFGKYNEFYGAIQTGKNLKAIIQKYTDNGVTADTLKSQITGHFKPLYVEMSTSEKANIKGYLLNAMTLLGMTREEAEKKVGEWEFEGKYGFAYDDKKQQFLDGNVSAAEMKSIIMSVEGKTEQEANSAIVSYSRDAYEDGYFTRSEAASIMTTYGGLTAGEAESKLRYIDVKLQFPDTYVDDAWVDEYYYEIESSGISIEAFVDYRNKVKGITGDGKKDRRMDVIDSMPITKAQKDALYYAEGWAASTIDEAPWH